MRELINCPLGARNATDLAVFRILVVAGWLAAVDPRLAAHYALYPPKLTFAPAPWGGLLPVFPVSAGGVGGAYAVFCAAALAALIGWRTRLALVLVLLAGGYLLTVPQFFGKLNHTNHLVWFALLLIASPCADALSLDARRSWRAAGPRADSNEPAIRYSLPLIFALVLVAIAYFFPGYWKLALVGPRWATPGPMVNLLHAKWSEFDGWSPWPRIDRWPRLCAAAGALTLIFEVGFLPLVLWPRTRAWVAVGGLVFHMATGCFMRIALWHLAIGYAGLVRWHSRWSPAPRAPPTRQANTGASRGGRAWPCAIVGALLVAGNLHNGVRRKDWWPLGVYPTFAYLAPDRLDMLRVRAEFHDGTQRVLTEQMLGRCSAPERARGMAAAILDSEDPGPLLRAYWVLWTRLDPSLESAQRVICERTAVLLDPDLGYPSIQGSSATLASWTTKRQPGPLDAP